MILQTHDYGHQSLPPRDSFLVMQKEGKPKYENYSIWGWCYAHLFSHLMISSLMDSSGYSTKYVWDRNHFYVQKEAVHVFEYN
jgi:hypothetical protein